MILFKVFRTNHISKIKTNLPEWHFFDIFSSKGKNILISARIREYEFCIQILVPRVQFKGKITN